MVMNPLLFNPISADSVRQMNLEVVTRLRDAYQCWTGEGLGRWTSHRPDLWLGTRTVCCPVELPRALIEQLRTVEQAFVAELRQESDGATIARVQETFSAAWRGNGLSELLPLSDEVIVKIKRRALSGGPLNTIVDFVPVPVEIIDGEPHPIVIDDDSNSWETMHRLVLSGEIQFVFLAMEAQGSFSGYCGFSHAFIQNGAFERTDIERFDDDVRQNVFRHNVRFGVVDYKVNERPGERHHALGDKILTGSLWGAGVEPIDIRDLAKYWQNGGGSSLQFLNNTTIRELAVAFKYLDSNDRHLLTELINQDQLWYDHPAAFTLITKGMMPSIFARYGRKSLLIPSFGDPVSAGYYAPREFVIAKPVTGDSGYGVTLGTPSSVLSEIGGEGVNVCQPIVDLLRLIPNRMTGGPLKKGGVPEIRMTPLQNFGFFRIGAHVPYSPEKGAVMMEQEYVMNEINALVAQQLEFGDVSQDVAWSRALMQANIGFGVFKVS
jgi:hypothetical protein